MQQSTLQSFNCDIAKKINIETTPKNFGVVITNHLYVVGRTKYVHWANSCRGEEAPHFVGETSTSTRSTVIFAYLGNSIHVTFLTVESHHQCTSKWPDTIEGSCSWLDYKKYCAWSDRSKYTSQTAYRPASKERS